MASQATDNDAPTGNAVVPISAQRDSYVIMKDKARNFAMSALLPDAIKSSNPDQAFANCLIALQMAEVMGEMPLVVMQNIHIVKGKVGFAAQYMIARANASGLFSGRINWRVDNSDPKNLSVTAYASLAETGEEVSFTVDMAMAQAEGWTSNNKYKTMPEVMLRYRSAVFLVRFYAPDVMLGYRTSDEIEDITAAAVADTAKPALTSDMLIGQSKPVEQAGEAKAEPEDAEIEEVEAETVEPEPQQPSPEPDQPQAPAGELALDENADWRAKADELLGGIRNSKNASYLDDIAEQYREICVQMPKAMCAEIEGALAAKRAELAGGGK